MNRQLRINPPAQWTANVHAGVVEHATGLRIEFTALTEVGRFEGVPRNIPHDMPWRTLSRLIRQGFDEFRNAVAQQTGKRAILVLKAH